MWRLTELLERAGPLRLQRYVRAKVEQTIPPHSPPRNALAQNETVMRERCGHRLGPWRLRRMDACRGLPRTHHLTQLRQWFEKPVLRRVDEVVGTADLQISRGLI